MESQRDVVCLGWPIVPAFMSDRLIERDKIVGGGGLGAIIGCVSESVYLTYGFYGISGFRGVVCRYLMD